MNRNLIRFSILSAVLALGCGNKSSDGASAKGAAATGTTGAAAPGGIVATCVKGKTICVEYKNTIPDFAADMCHAGPDYVWKPGAAPCPTDKLLGKCVSKAVPDETTYWYGGPEELDIDKGICEAVGQWTAATPARATANATAAAATPAPPGAAKRKKK
jgi:hypothetical protein